MTVPPCPISAPRASLAVRQEAVDGVEVCEACGMLRLTSFRTGSAELRAGGRGMRLRVEITTREAAQPRPPVALRQGCWLFTMTSSNRHRAQPADTTMYAGDHDPGACP